VSKHKFGFLSPQPYMEKALKDLRLVDNIEIIETKGWSDSEIDVIVEDCKAKGVESVAGFAQKDAFHHILINEKLGLQVPSRLAFLYCMNKYLMRELETNPNYYDWVDPATETNEEIVAKIKEWPFMLKNTSLSLGRGVFRIDDKEGLVKILNEYRADDALQKEIADNYLYYKKGIPEADLPEKIPPFIAEHFMEIDRAIEYCYEGYITPEGKVMHYALTEEVYFSNHQALGYITPPISLTNEIAPELEAWMDDYMGKMSDLGYRNQFFNIEFWITHEGEITLVEINPRAAHSYHYNYKLTYDNSLYGDNFRLAAGLPLEKVNPWEKWKNAGDPETYTLIVLITAKETGRAGDIVDYDYIDQEDKNGHIDVVRLTKQEDDVLADADMTSAGVMLMQLWVSGSRDEVISREIEIRKKVYKHTQKDNDTKYPDYWKPGS